MIAALFCWIGCGIGDGFTFRRVLLRVRRNTGFGVEWKEINDDLVLYGYYGSVIAELRWNPIYEVWELQSDWLDCS